VNNYIQTTRYQLQTRMMISLLSRMLETLLNFNTLNRDMITTWRIGQANLMPTTPLHQSCISDSRMHANPQYACAQFPLPTTAKSKGPAQCRTGLHQLGQSGTEPRRTLSF
jgi:hypothetical protein